MSLRRPLHIVVAAFVFVAVACGGDDDPASTTAASPETTAAATTAATTSPDATQAPAGEDRSGELLGRWEIVNYALPDGGGLTNVVGDDPVFIEFNADGSVDYNTGCNTGGTEFEASGSYYEPESALDTTPAGQPVTLGPAFEQTERGCDGFLGDQDRDLPDNMGAVTRFVLDGDRLLLVDEFLLVEATR
ncbi:MAG: META domain-containing protein [Acidimicrobiia bacterium]|nr:META domain-containing protein [Acidimicrobiia bacterium]